MNTDIKKVPKLRFKEFRGELLEKKLSEVTEWSSGGTPPKDVKKYWGGNIPWISASSMHGYEFFQSDRTLTEDGLKNGSRLAKKGTLLLLVRGSMLFNTIPVGIATRDVAFNQDVKAIVCAGVDSYYLLYFLSSSKHKLLSLVVGTGIGAGKLDLYDLLHMKVFLPELEEQQKIAEFLTPVDEKISVLQKKKELLQKYKKGVMQAIFSQNIRLRDVNRKDYPDWQAKKLGELGKTYNGLTGKNALDFGTGYQYITYKQIFDNQVINVDKSALVEIAPREKQNMAEYGDIFFTTSSETALEVGFASVLLKSVDKLYLNSFCFGYRIGEQNSFSPKFAIYLFRSSQFRKLIIKLAQGSTRFNMSKNELMKVTINLPCFIEQERIADFLTFIDDKINLAEKELEQAKNFKKALLQQMFV